MSFANPSPSVKYSRLESAADDHNNKHAVSFGDLSFERDSLTGHDSSRSVNNNFKGSSKGSSSANLVAFFGFLPSSHDFAMRVLTAFFYGLTSLLIIMINKIVLTNYHFPSFHALGVGQMLATIVVLQVGKTFQLISFPSVSREVPRKIFPLPLFYLGNLVCGLGATKRLSLPMFTVLRRFTIPLTLILEKLVLSVHQSTGIVASVVMMVVGALIAAGDDLAFDSFGYALVLSNDCCTAANGVIMKKKLESRDLGKYGLMYYNALFMLLPLVAITMWSGELNSIAEYEYLHDFWFLMAFLFSSIMGFVLMWATVLCTARNSALTTTVIGCLKNIIVTYVGMTVGGDYIYSHKNFIGVNISMFASLVYSWLTFVSKNEAKPLHPKAASLNTVLKIDN